MEPCVVWFMVDPPPLPHEQLALYKYTYIVCRIYKIGQIWSIHLISKADTYMIISLLKKKYCKTRGVLRK